VARAAADLRARLFPRPDGADTPELHATAPSGLQIATYVSPTDRHASYDGPADHRHSETSFTTTSTPQEGYIFTDEERLQSTLALAFSPPPNALAG
jgi:hypothetical protein